jgi:hypothetical protein
VDGKQLRLTKESFIEWYIVFRFEMSSSFKVSKRKEQVKSISTADHIVVASEKPDSVTTEVEDDIAAHSSTVGPSLSSTEKTAATTDAFQFGGTNTLMGTTASISSTDTGMNTTEGASRDKLIRALTKKYDLTEEDIDKEDISASIVEAEKA